MHRPDQGVSDHRGAQAILVATVTLWCLHMSEHKDKRVSCDGARPELAHLAYLDPHKLPASERPKKSSLGNGQ